MGKLSRFDLISDIHLDHWISPVPCGAVQSRKIEKLFSRMLPVSPSPVLVIAGDMGHYNNQNYLMLEFLKQYYEHILIVRGNHDLYLVSNQQRRKFGSSDARWEDMKNRASALDNLHFLEGTCVTIDGVTFGGTGMWYDFQYGMQCCGHSLEQMTAIWQEMMNDGRYISGIPDAEEEKRKLESVLARQPDVIVTHVGPDWTHAKNRYARGVTKSFYFFDGQAYLDQCEGKIWCFGHIHEHYFYIHKGCRLENNAMGYPGDFAFPRIRTIQIGPRNR